MGSGAGELIAARARPVPLAPRTRVHPPASVRPLVRAAPPLGAAAESRSAKTSRGSQPATRGVGHLIPDAHAHARPPKPYSEPLPKRRQIYTHCPLLVPCELFSSFVFTIATKTNDGLFHAVRAPAPATHRPSPLVQRSAPVSWQTAPRLRFLRRDAERNTNSGPTGCHEYTRGMLPRNNM